MTISVARRTLSASGWRVLPKFENESMATRGSTLNQRATSAARIAVSAERLRAGLDVHRRVGEEVNIFVGGDHVEPRDALDAGARADDLQRGANRIGIVLVDAGDKSVRVAQVDHHGAEIIEIEHPIVRFGARNAGALAQAEEFIDVLRHAREACGVNDLALDSAESQLLEFFLNHCRAAQ